MAGAANALPDPAIVLIEDDSSAISDDLVAQETAELLEALLAGPQLDLGDVDAAALIRQDRSDRGA